MNRGVNRRGAAAAVFLVITGAACGHEASPAAPDAAPSAPLAFDAALSDAPDLLDASGSDASPSDASPPETPDAGRPLSPGDVHTVLHLGDSMVGFKRGLTMALEARFEKQGAKFYSNSWTSAQVRTFDEDDRLERLSRKFKPDLIILNLGTNNVGNPNPEALIANIRSIVAKMRPAACYWLGPPLPIKGIQHDKGIRRVISENIAPCKFFDSARLTLERQTDHVHPTDRGGEVWADAVWHFIFDGAPSDKVEDAPPDPLSRKARAGDEKPSALDTRPSHAKL